MRTDILAIETRTERGCTIVSLAGELDLETVPALQQALNACTDGEPVIVDISALTFILSAGLHTLLDQRADALVYKPHSNIARILEIVRADKHVPLYEELPTALHALVDRPGRDASARNGAPPKPSTPAVTTAL